MSQLDNTKVKRLMTYRYVVWGVLSLAYIIVFFHRLAVGVVRDELVNTFNITGATFGNLGSTYFYAYMLMQIPSGMLADSLGARKTVTVGTLLAGIGSIVFGYAPTIMWAFLGRLVVGLGVSVVFISILKIQSQWFKESEFGTMSGITSFVGNLGGILAKAPLVIMVGYLTWRVSFAVIGVLSIVISILCYVLARNTPQEMGLPSIAEIEGREVKKSFKKKPNLIKGLIKVISNSKTWPGFVVFAGFFGAFVTLSGSWGEAYLIEVYNIPKVKAASYTMTAVIGLAVGSIVIGKFSDSIKKRKLPMFVFGTVYVISWTILVFLNGGKPPIEILMPLLFMLGFTCPVFVLGWACAKEVNPPEIAGISTSVVNIGGFLGAAILPPLLGKVFDKFAGTMSPVELYHKAFMYSFISALIGFIFIFLIKETNCRNVYKD
ncbi:MFS transporter [Paramaledivibacter caminithermalis]|jgi:sugar phosphate permease|uniref:Sugar phosphate permease n=1 Tax=Paramaledivibacter caminithermalis (strain DSM 15212 / CIP 107654 / DViRD3) TaxID=1121301 RepID=A0A1M6L864_PARC5|nr:MFS transporter [Paramaledivibacter caminithermalis]SHJ67385.1 Sugar phosphate permease [Paramaledivibacter caminithermalis DSM 15212]